MGGGGDVSKRPPPRSPLPEKTTIKEPSLIRSKERNNHQIQEIQQYHKEENQSRWETYLKEQSFSWLRGD